MHRAVLCIGPPLLLMRICQPRSWQVDLAAIQCRNPGMYICTALYKATSNVVHTFPGHILSYKILSSQVFSEHHQDSSQFPLLAI